MEELDIISDYAPDEFRDTVSSKLNEMAIITI